MRIIAYTFDADVHCPACTKQQSDSMKIDHNHPYAMGDTCVDDCGVEYDVVDHDGNLIRPVFSTDESGFTHCGDCHEKL